MKKTFCMAITCLVIVLYPVCVLAKDTGICSTGNELFYHSMVGKGVQRGISVEAFSRFTTTKNELGNQVLSFRYPDNALSNIVDIALFSNADGFTESIVIQYSFVNGVTPPSANVVLDLCAKTCFLTDSEVATAYLKARNGQYDYEDVSFRVVSVYSSVNKKVIYIATITPPNSNLVTFIFSSHR